MRIRIKKLPQQHELNARKWEHGYGGNLFSGITESTQQMQVGKDYWAQLVNKPTWLDTFITPVNGGQLSEVVVKPTNDESWLFSLGKYARNGRKPLADSHARKVVANYLSRFDNESAKDYNARISRLADALDIRGVQFIKNNVESGKLKNRAHYDTKSNTAYIDDMHDIFAEVSHPWQDAKGNNFMYDEVKKGNYNPDIDSRGGTRYAYPDTFEGETHGFFEPALTEWVETGKIGRSLPLLNEDLSNEKIVPKDNIEVLDSAASWNKQAIDKRVIANPHQLPLTKRIQYSIWDYPLLNKKKALGGNIYDGTFEGSQQMDNSYTYYKPLDNIFVDSEGNLRDPEVPRAKGSILLPEVTAAYPDLKDMAGRYNIASNDAITVANGRPVNMHLRKTVDEGAKKYAARAQDNPYLHMAEVAAGAIPLAIAAVPAVVGGGELVATALANPYIDAGITSAFAGHGLNHAINEGIDGWGDAAMTALEVLPLGRLVKPVYEGIVRPGMRLFNSTLTSRPRYSPIIQRSVGTNITTGTSEETAKAVEKGRKTLLDWVKSPFYKARLEDEPLYRVADDVVADAGKMIEDVPIDISKTKLEIDPSGIVNGTTVTRPATQTRLPNGTIVADLDTGLDVNVASDLGKEADETTLHELLHYMTANSKGEPISQAGERIIKKGWMEPTETHFDAINIIHKNRSKSWQDFIMDQNDSLLPQYDPVVKMVMEEPDKAISFLQKAGRTEADAKSAVQSLRARYSEWYDIQEQRAYLQQLFHTKIRPNLKNPNDAAEIEEYLSLHPEVLDDYPAYGHIQEVRPGSLKDYAKYFSAALGTIPFIPKLAKDDEK